jgi:hypothetical protein
MKPAPNNYPSYYQRYINKVNNDDLLSAFREQESTLKNFLEAIPESKSDFAYAKGKWTVKQLLQHCIDTERVFAFRSMWFARKDPNPLPGFEEDDWAKMADTSHRSLKDMISEFLAVRKASYHFFSSLTADMLEQKGKANNNTIQVLAMGFIILGHWEHHRSILQERYGI